MNKIAATSSQRFGIGLGFVGFAAILAARGWELETKIFPVTLGLVLIATAVAQVATDLVGSKAKDDAGTGDKSEAISRDALGYFAWLIGFLCTVYLIGVSWGGPVFTIAFMAAHRVNWKIILGVAVVIVFFVSVLMSSLLGMSLYGGIISRWL